MIRNSVEKGRKIFLGAVICCAVIIGFSACGKKEAPRVPGPWKLPVAVNIKIEKTDGQLSLSWSLPDAEAAGGRDVAGFYVYRGLVSDAIAGCPTCPVDYDRVGDVAFMDDRTVPETWYFTDEPPAGSRYRYKVRCYTDSGRTGPGSKPVEAALQESKP